MCYNRRTHYTACSTNHDLHEAVFCGNVICSTFGDSTYEQVIGHCMHCSRRLSVQSSEHRPADPGPMRSGRPHDEQERRYSVSRTLTSTSLSSVCYVCDAPAAPEGPPRSTESARRSRTHSTSAGDRAAVRRALSHLRSLKTWHDTASLNFDEDSDEDFSLDDYSLSDDDQDGLPSPSFTTDSDDDFEAALLEIEKSVTDANTRWRQSYGVTSNTLRAPRMAGRQTPVESVRQRSVRFQSMHESQVTHESSGRVQLTPKMPSVKREQRVHWPSGDPVTATMGHGGYSETPPCDMLNEVGRSGYSKKSGPAGRTGSILKNANPLPVAMVKPIVINPVIIGMGEGAMNLNHVPVPVGIYLKLEDVDKLRSLDPRQAARDANVSTSFGRHLFGAGKADKNKKKTRN